MNTYFNPGIAALVLFILIVGVLLVLLLRNAAHLQQMLSNTLSDFLETPSNVERVWYEKADEIRGEFYIWGRQIEGAKQLLAIPRDAADVWSRLQSAGILVHNSP